MNLKNDLLFTAVRLPGRVDGSTAAALLGVADHDIPILIVSRLLIPLGNPTSNAPKYFASEAILLNAKDADWLNKATRVIAKHWRHKNERQKQKKLGENGCQQKCQQTVRTDTSD